MIETQLTISLSLYLLLVLAAFLLDDRGRLVVVVFARRSCLALFGATLLRSRSRSRSGGRDASLTTSILNLLEQAVVHGLHAADRSALELSGSLVPVDLWCVISDGSGVR